MDKHGARVMGCLTQFLLRLTESDVADPIARDGTPNKGYQTLLQEQGAITLVHKLVELPFRHISPGLVTESARTHFGPTFMRLCQLGYRVLQQLCKNNNNNKNKSVFILPELRQKLETVFKTACTEVIRAIYTNNNILLEAVRASDISVFIEMIALSKQPQFVNLLEALCLCEGSPVPSNQNAIVTALFEENLDLLPTVVDGGNGMLDLVVAKDKDFPDPVRLSDVSCAEGRTVDDLEDFDAALVSTNERLILYHHRLLHLFSCLTSGRNMKARRALLHHSAKLGVKYSFLLQTLRMDLPNMLLSDCCMIMASLYVDC